MSTSNVILHERPCRKSGSQAANGLSFSPSSHHGYLLSPSADGGGAGRDRFAASTTCLCGTRARSLHTAGIVRDSPGCVNGPACVASQRRGSPQGEKGGIKLYRGRSTGPNAGSRGLRSRIPLEAPATASVRSHAHGPVRLGEVEPTWTSDERCRKDREARSNGKAPESWRSLDHTPRASAPQTTLCSCSCKRTGSRSRRIQAANSTRSSSP